LIQTNRWFLHLTFGTFAAGQNKRYILSVSHTDPLHGLANFNHDTTEFVPRYKWKTMVFDIVVMTFPTVPV
jgi:hypothetical protein